MLASTLTRAARGSLGKGAVAVVPVQQVVVGNGSPGFKLSEAAHEDVDPAVVVVVSNGGTEAPVEAIDSRCSGTIGEGAVTVVDVQGIGCTVPPEA